MISELKLVPTKKPVKTDSNVIEKSGEESLEKSLEAKEMKQIKYPGRRSPAMKKRR